MCSRSVFAKAMCLLSSSWFFFSFIVVCAEAYNPDEEEEDTDPRVRIRMKMVGRIVTFLTDSPALQSNPTGNYIKIIIATRCCFFKSNRLKGTWFKVWSKGMLHCSHQKAKNILIPLDSAVAPERISS